MDNTIPFEKDMVKKFLDKRIRFWRKQRSRDEFALYYIDAYQRVRCSLFGERLPLEKE